MLKVFMVLDFFIHGLHELSSVGPSEGFVRVHSVCIAGGCIGNGIRHVLLDLEVLDVPNIIPRWMTRVRVHDLGGATMGFAVAREPGSAMLVDGSAYDEPSLFD